MGERSAVDSGRASPGSVRLSPKDLGDDELMVNAWTQSRERAKTRHGTHRLERHRRRRRLGAALASGTLVAAAAALVLPALDLGRQHSADGSDLTGAIVLRERPEQADAAGDRRRPASARGEPTRPRIVPEPGTLKEAWQYARARGGAVSIATVDTRGRLRGQDEDRLYSSASVVKSMLLAAELHRLERERLSLDAETKSLLDSMITISDNDAADAIYARVGDAGLFEVARLVGMSRFTVAGHWGNAQITAADMARMFSNLDRLFANRHREFGLGLLGSVVPEQSWGIPAAARPSWAVRFKGGWVITERGQLTHQAAELRDGHKRIAIAVLTDYQPSMSYATQTIRGVAERLLSSRRARDRAAPAQRGS